MIALDGYAEKIVIVSSQLSKRETFTLANNANCNIIISSKNLENDREHKFLTFKSFEDLNNSKFSNNSEKIPLETEWVLSTTGTTGMPKLVSHTFKSLTKTTKANTNNAYRWGLLYDYSRFAGLQVLLQSILSEIYSVSSGTNSIKKQIDFLIKNKCTHLSGTPSMWRKILISENFRNLNLIQITLGGEISDEKILATLCKFFPDTRITHIFASTEAGVGFSVSDKKPGFPLDYLKQPPLGIELKIVKGILHIKNKLVRKKYVGLKQSISDKDGWVKTGDIVKVGKDRVVFVGRENGVINVGGEKVYPEEVENILLSHNLVAFSKVYSIKSPIIGSLLAADIVLSDKNKSHKKAVEDLNKYLDNKLQRHKVPKKLLIKEYINMNSGGKIVRN